MSPIFGLPVSVQLLRHREKVLANAEQQLALQGKLDTKELLDLYKRFLKVEEHRILLQHKSGGGGRQICGLRASLIDIVLRHLLQLALPESGRKNTPPIAIVALGGYGRAELNPCSDVDIMFLVADSSSKLPKVLQDAIERIYYMLLDSGLKVGDHSTRTVAEAIKQANADMLNKTTMLEARLVAGDTRVFDQFHERYLRLCVESHVDDYIAARIANQAERHEKFGKSIYMQEPNIKNGCGGLRDYQNLLWMAFFKFRVQTTAALVERKFCNEAERRLLEKAYDFLLRVRNELHYLNKRHADVLVLSQQLPIATLLGYPQKNILRRSEAFMRDYYTHARNIYYLSNVLCERMALPVPDPNPKKGLMGLLRRKSQIERFDGFYSSDGRLYHESRDIFTQDHTRLMRMFQHLQLRELHMSAELQHLVRRRLHLVDKTFCYAKANRETFIAICSRKGQVGHILRAMHEVDFLGRYIPEFGQLTALVQHEFFHRYTADEHTLVCLEKLDRVIDTTDSKFLVYQEIFRKLDDPFVLYLALLLHDTGKAANARNHSEASAVYASRVARRLQLGPEQRKSLVLLVDNHIVMSMTAQRRNLDDPATIAEFAAVVKSQANLDMLMLLTLADGQGVGDDEKWSDWKENLVRQLYHSTSLYLADGEAFYRQRTIEREGLRHEVEKKLPANFTEEIDTHFEFMPDRYFQTHMAPEIADHVRLFREFFTRCFNTTISPLTPAVRWVPRPNQGHTEVWISGWDRRELLARIAGSFSSAGLNILSADVYTRGDNLVLDFFRVSTTEYTAVTDERDWKGVEKRLATVLEKEDYDFTEHLEKQKKRRRWHLSQELDFPTRIAIDNDAHPNYTLIDVQTPDRLGLLYTLLRAVGRAGAHIHLSRIATEKGAAIDTFYVTDAEGKKIKDQKSVARLQQALRDTSQQLAVTD